MSVKNTNLTILTNERRVSGQLFLYTYLSFIGFWYE